jgi:hypothetical protein
MLGRTIDPTGKVPPGPNVLRVRAAHADPDGDLPQPSTLKTFLKPKKVGFHKVLYPRIGGLICGSWPTWRSWRSRNASVKRFGGLMLLSLL